MGKISKAAKALSPSALTALGQLGTNIREARTRRGMTQVELATRASTNHVTLKKLEQGQPSVGLGVLVQVLDILGLVNDLPLLANPDTDSVGKSLQDLKRPQRVRSSSKKQDALDF
ncbi:helix-turn-helix domain-containing protein [Pseudodesulfovibrio sp. JC047]|uniref:helix-turn-helix domain-containing protein n=1 Tax=Pseudodesulfovibrio sp. JC047 TaxID=2683199 RepID=UPI0013D8A200|nr:helix-turn-helix domain-containing protein [Pseudodesulfovibrio sp. JC047]NDV18188.1 helix-turn-helix domain-containing protein [Pseudodesulfovibrio sp. JC047]